ncbi:class I SAM-dependent methyltransferase [Marinibaculum pumilum]|uniref:Class I SAM-dependent methyltransferase n=1 Tax=Marinibaculum pumilum TaxID=1766165 RepID=A0ABV7KYB3_9PROT
MNSPDADIPAIDESVAAWHAYEMRTGRRFAFGRNWARFIEGLGDDQIARAREALARSLQVDPAAVQPLAGRSFLDIGCGSGLTSLAARQLGAEVVSIDFDPEAVGCAQELRRRYRAADLAEGGGWRITQGSALDEDHLTALGHFDIVCSWGVLHHTGAMWEAIDLSAKRVAPGGLFFIAIYNDQGLVSRAWRRIKRMYNGWPVLRLPLMLAFAPYYVGLRWLVQQVRGRRERRGMSLWTDLRDWLGGWPFEVARPAEIEAFLTARGFTLLATVTVGRRQGCNEFLLRRDTPTAGG